MKVSKQGFGVLGQVEALYDSHAGQRKWQARGQDARAHTHTHLLGVVSSNTDMSKATLPPALLMEIGLKHSLMRISVGAYTANTHASRFD